VLLAIEKNQQLYKDGKLVLNPNKNFTTNLNAGSFRFEIKQPLSMATDQQ